jgi:cytochrome c553
MNRSAILLWISTAMLLHLGNCDAAAERVDELVRMSLQLDANVARGARAYRQQCAGCHSKDATGNSRDVIPALAGQREAYLIKQLADFAEQEREAPEMHAVMSSVALNEPQAWADVAAWLSQLPVIRNPQGGDGSGAELGAVIFQEQCIECHESDARGDEDGFAPSLRDQHYSYLVRQLRELAESHRQNVDPEFMEYIKSLDAREISAVADYLSRLRRPARDREKLRGDGTLRN